MLSADWIGTTRNDCTSDGACWVFISQRLNQFLYGFYPEAETWRLDLAFFMMAALIAWLIIPKTPFKGWVAAFTLLIFPFIAFVLLSGGYFGLETVETHKWGGLSLTLVLAVVGIVAALPFGVLLALGRRSEMPIVRSLSVVYIEIWRGVPLITVLFMASVMLPLFFPEDMNFDKLLRALIGITMFQSAYMAEVVRGGLQAIPKGQYEAADSLGLGYWQKMNMIILPQALKADDSGYREYLHRPVQGHQSGADYRPVRPAGNHAGLGQRPELDRFLNRGVCLCGAGVLGVLFRHVPLQHPPGETFAYRSR